MSWTKRVSEVVKSDAEKEAERRKAAAAAAERLAKEREEALHKAMVLVGTRLDEVHAQDEQRHLTLAAGTASGHSHAHLRIGGAEVRFVKTAEDIRLSVDGAPDERRLAYDEGSRSVRWYAGEARPENRRGSADELVEQVVMPWVEKHLAPRS